MSDPGPSDGEEGGGRLGMSGLCSLVGRSIGSRGPVTVARIQPGCLGRLRLSCGSGGARWPGGVVALRCEQGSGSLDSRSRTVGDQSA